MTTDSLIRCTKQQISHDAVFQQRFPEVYVIAAFITEIQILPCKLAYKS